MHRLKGIGIARELLEQYTFIDGLQKENVRFSGIMDNLRSELVNRQKAYASNCKRIEGFIIRAKELEDLYA